MTSEDDAKAEAELAARLARDRLRDLPKMSPGPRDVRCGDRWLPWHFAPLLTINSRDFGES